MTSKLKAGAAAALLTAVLACSGTKTYVGQLDGGVAVYEVYDSLLRRDYTVLRLTYPDKSKLHLRDNGNNGTIDVIETWDAHGNHSKIARDNELPEAYKEELFANMQHRYETLLSEIVANTSSIGK